LLNRHGHTIAAITIAGPAARIPASRFAEIGRAIATDAAEAARRFEE
jgi:DNA-binding IclR family transcriptional regulator